MDLDNERHLPFWYMAAKEMKLTWVTHPEADELVIFNKDHIERGFAWIKPFEILACRDLATTATVTTERGAIELMRHLANVVKCQFCGALLHEGEEHEHFGKQYRHHGS